MMKLTLNRDDVVAAVGELKASKALGELKGDAVLGPTDERAIFDLLPAIIARKIKGVVPPEFVLAEMEIEFELEGDITVARVQGSVRARFVTSAKPS